MTEGFILFLGLVGLVVAWLFWIHIPAKMARTRGRSALELSFCLSWEIVQRRSQGMLLSRSDATEYPS